MAKNSRGRSFFFFFFCILLFYSILESYVHLQIHVHTTHVHGEPLYTYLKHSFLTS